LDTIRDGLKGIFPNANLIKAKTQGITDEIEKKQKSLEPWTTQINEKKAVIALTQSELDLIREKESQSLKAIEQVQERIKALTTNKLQKESELKAAKNESKTLEKQTSDAKEQSKSLQQKGTKIYEALSQARARAEEAKSSLAASQTQGQVLSSLSRLRDSGRIQGFHVCIPLNQLT
jgi:structural maintenance of chromosome 4